ncbi:MAG: 3-octaprenyl-4-hydroxybenzoate carboxy-lyase [Rhodospirillaceae bacterium TMED8]|nr:3-octaprenyl-4-hydroxybenzoate carboxy-lyase [Magnetovibrio sp.]OUT50233.1 MAG: 3-octaprenyl-4-hydroxybenzoate carboxy-lyase [Rhodospirillaceae bacterium TMED8]
MDEISREKRRVFVAISGASGAVYGIRLLEMLGSCRDIEVHFSISKAGGVTLLTECQRSLAEVEALADVVHLAGNVGAPPASGSFGLDAMIIAPCSIKTASNIAYGNTADLITRTADVMIKERRMLVLAVRETPMHAGHLETLSRLAQLGAIIFPPVPAFYHQPQSVLEIVDQSCMRMLDQINIRVEYAPRWGENKGVPAVGANIGSSQKN